MKHDPIYQIYGDVFLGVPMEAGETWPRFDVMLRNDQEISWVSEDYERAVRIFEMGDPDNAEERHQTLRLICARITDPEPRIAALKEAILADQAARAQV